MNQKIRPVPPVFRKLLSVLLSSSLREGALEDYEDRYYSITEKHGEKKARRWYRMQAVSMIPAFFINLIIWARILSGSFYKASLRNFNRRRAFSLINITGLTAGLACALLITVWVFDELQYDTFHERLPDLYRVETSRKSSGKTVHEIFSPSPLVEALQQEFPEVISATNTTWAGGMPYRYKDKVLSENRIMAVDPSFFPCSPFRPCAATGKIRSANPIRWSFPNRLHRNTSGRKTRSEKRLPPIGNTHLP